MDSTKTHVLVGNDGEDYERVQSCGEKARSVSDWVVPKSASKGDKVLLFFNKAGFVASGRIGTVPKPGTFGKQAVYRSDIGGIKLFESRVPLEHVRQAIPKWGWVRQAMKSKTTPTPSIVGPLWKTITEYQKLTPPRTFLLVWNRDTFDWEDLEERVESLTRGASVSLSWSCGMRRDLPVNSEIFLLKLGSLPLEEKGLIGHGVATSSPTRRSHWSGSHQKSSTFYVRVDVDSLAASPAIDLPRLKQLAPQFGWTPQGSGIEVPQEVAKKIRTKWPGRGQVTRLPDELEAGVSYPEGAVRTVRVNSYERSRQARDACVDRHGSACSACGLDFGKRYGPIAKGLIHVHHTVPISRLKHGYQVDPIQDLVPLCPNCHAVAHLADPPFTVDEIREFLGKRG